MTGNYSTREYREKLYDDLHVRLRDTVILMCAIFIASIGLNMNSTAVIIGAMLISPLMTPIVGMGFGLALFDLRLVKQSLQLLSTQVIVSLLVSTLYFWISPLTHASSELVARTSPTIWDVLIAIAGGIAGVIGSRKKEANNIVPGVAIATALMPPICTAGYGLANGNSQFFFGALYLFFINCIFIMLTNLIGSLLLMRKSALSSFREISLKVRLGLLALIIILIMPAIYSGVNLTLQYAKRDAISQFIKTEFAQQTIISQNYNETRDRLNLTLVGERLSDQDLQAIEAKQEDYGLSSMTLVVNQVVDTPNLSEESIKTLYDNIDIYIDQKLAEKDNSKDTLVESNKEKDKD
ncbi:MAG: DUF389 domain-containing protein [Streptococcus minor]|nr:DUF389 domain-containing protein [Streptococcus minor]